MAKKMKIRTTVVLEYKVDPDDYKIEDDDGAITVGRDLGKQEIVSIEHDVLEQHPGILARVVRNQKTSIKVVEVEEVGSYAFVE